MIRTARISLGAIALLALTLLAATTAPTYHFTHLYFKPDTTLEQATLALAPYKVPGESLDFLWIHQTTDPHLAWSGGIEWDPTTQQIQDVYNAHWKKYASLLQLSIKANDASLPIWQEELQRLTQAGIIDCWTNAPHSCPPVAVTEYETAFRAEDVKSILALPIVDHQFEPPATIRGQATFFLLDLWLTVQMNSHRLRSQ